MKYFWLILLCLGLNLPAQEIKSELKKEINKEFKISYLFDIPQNTKKKIPLIVFLHGSGERGTDLEKVKLNGPFQHKNLMDEPVAILAPQCPEGEWWNTDHVYELIKEMISKYPIDPSRIYLTGLSMGGWGVWKLANEYPEMFAALAPVCAPTDRWMKATAHRYEGLPIKIFHGGNDDIVSPMDAIQMYQELKKRNVEVSLTIFPDDNHNSWDSTYSDPQFYNWLLSKHKN